MNQVKTEQTNPSQSNYEQSRVGVAFGDDFEKGPVSFRAEAHFNQQKAMDQYDTLKNIVGDHIDIEWALVCFLRYSPGKKEALIDSITKIKDRPRFEAFECKIHSDETYVYFSVKLREDEESQIKGSLEVILENGLREMVKNQDNYLNFEFDANYDFEQLVQAVQFLQQKRLFIRKQLYIQINILEYNNLYIKCMYKYNYYNNKNYLYILSNLKYNILNTLYLIQNIQYLLQYQLYLKEKELGQHAQDKLAELNLFLTKNFYQGIEKFVDGIDKDAIESPPLAFLKHFKNLDMDLRFRSTDELPQIIKNQMIFGEEFQTLAQEELQLPINRTKQVNAIMEAAADNGFIYLTISDLCAVKIESHTPKLSNFLTKYGKYLAKLVGLGEFVPEA